MNHHTITANLLVAFIAFFAASFVLVVVAKAFSSATYPTTSSDDLWTEIDRDSDSYVLYEWLKEDGYIDSSVDFDEFDYIFVLTQQLCSQTRHVRPSIALAVIAIESRFDVNAKNGTARGLMQMIPAYHSNRMQKFTNELVNLDHFYDPRLNIATGLDYLDYILDETDNDVIYALMWYNEGPTIASKRYLDDRIWSWYALNVIGVSKKIDIFCGEEVL